MGIHDRKTSILVKRRLLHLYLTVPSRECGVNHGHSYSVVIGDFLQGDVNVQFAVSPEWKEDIYCIEIKPLGFPDSSALGFQGTGFLVRKIAAKAWPIGPYLIINELK